MDELQTIGNFESHVEAPTAAREAARAKLVRARLPARNGRRKRMIVGILVAVAVCSGTALGAGAIGLFPGHAPSRSARAQLSAFNHPTEFLRALSETPGLLVAQARGVTAQATSNGTLLLWGVPVRNGNLCTFIQLVGERQTGAFRYYAPRHPDAPEPGACAGGRTIQPPILWSQRLFGQNARRVVEGHVNGTVSALLLQHGKTSIHVPLYDGFFLLEIPSDTQPRTLIARSQQGRTIAKQSLPAIPSPSRSFAAPAFYDFDLLFEANTFDGSGAVSAVRFGQGGIATWGVTIMGAASGGRVNLRSRHIELAGLDNALAGYVGPGAHSAVVEYSDRSQEAVPLVRGFFFWFKSPIAIQKHGRPTKLISRDAHGRTLYSAIIG